ncbi:hypothetical protein LG293_17170 (plasmid) [Citricoccus nitrophenolicus]
MKKILQRPAVATVIDHADLWVVPLIVVATVLLMVAGGALTPQWMLMLLPLLLAGLMVVVAVKLRESSRGTSGTVE